MTTPCSKSLDRKLAAIQAEKEEIMKQKVEAEKENVILAPPPSPANKCVVKTPVPKPSPGSTTSDECI